MNLKELKTLSASGEGQYIEFKKNANQPEQIAEEFVGFANSLGGYLFVGIDDQGLISGLKFAEDDLIFLNEYINSIIDPVPLYTNYGRETYQVCPASIQNLHEGFPCQYTGCL